MIYKLNQYDKIAPLFEGWEETMIWSCLQNVMGHIYTDHLEAPTAAMAVLGDFRLLAGAPSMELVAFSPEERQHDFAILIPGHEGWSRLIEAHYKDRARRVTRYAFHKDQDGFDLEALKRAVEALPAGFELLPINREIFNQCQNIPWCCDFVSQFETYEAFEAYGLGVVMRNTHKEIVSGASSYSAYEGGIEVEIDTRSDYRRQGFAYICAAQLILNCIRRGLYPSWDAQNPRSAALAKKLGYRLFHTYPAYEI